MRCKTLVLFLLFQSLSALAQNDKNLNTSKSQLNAASDTERVIKMLERADSFKRLNSDSMKLYSEKAFNLSQQINYGRGKALAQVSIASAIYNSGDNPAAKRICLKAIDDLRAVGTFSELGNANNLLGLIYMSEGKYVVADSAYHEALKAFSAAGDEMGKAKIHHNLGVIAFYQNQMEESVSYYLDAIRESEKAGDNAFTAVVTTNLGLVFSSQKEYGRAILYLRKALTLYAGTKDLKGKAKTLTGLGTAFFNQASYDSSLLYHSNALELFTESGDLAGKSESLNNIAEVYIEKNLFEQAIPLIQESDSLRIAFGDAYGHAISTKNFAKVYAGLGRNQLAEDYFEEALKLAEAIPAKWLEGEILLSRANYFEGIGDFASALRDWKLRTQINENIYSEERSAILAEMETRFKAEQARAEVAERDIRIERLESQGNRLLILVGSVIVIALLGGLLAFQVYKRNNLQNRIRLEIAVKDLEIERQQKEIEENKRQVAEQALSVSEREQNQMKSELDFKRKELTQMALYIHQQNEVLESLKDELSGLKSGEARKLERDLEQKLNIAKQREAFEMNVDLMNEDFYHRLDSQFPNITENDKKLCAMVRLGLSSKEIASIINISPKSVDMSRYRLRKKLNLEAETELGQFLVSI